MTLRLKQFSEVQAGWPDQAPSDEGAAQRTTNEGGDEQYNMGRPGRRPGMDQRDVRTRRPLPRRQAHPARAPAIRSANPKHALKLRIDAGVVEHFRATGPGWQTRINATLRRAAKLRKVD
jgi:uncharacterized protein (DUF4415 family)